MTPRWHRLRSRRSSAKAAGQPADALRAERPEPERGPRLLIECRDSDAEGAEILAALIERYEIEALSEEGRTFRVTVDDALYPDEAVVRLASVLDEIDRDWQQHLGWPKAQA